MRNIRTSRTGGVIALDQPGYGDSDWQKDALRHRTHHNLKPIPDGQWEWKYENRLSELTIRDFDTDQQWTHWRSVQILSNVVDRRSASAAALLPHNRRSCAVSDAEGA